MSWIDVITQLCTAPAEGEQVDVDADDHLPTTLPTPNQPTNVTTWSERSS